MTMSSLCTWQHPKFLRQQFDAFERQHTAWAVEAVEVGEALNAIHRQEIREDISPAIIEY